MSNTKAFNQIAESGSVSADSALAELVTLYREKRLMRAHPAVLRKYLRSTAALEQLLGRPPIVSDLTEENLQDLAAAKQASGATASTVREYRRHLEQLWNFAFSRGTLPTAADLPRLPKVRRTPFAWTESQINDLFRAVDASGFAFELPETGRKIEFRIWLRALLLVMWDTAERLGAVRRLTWKNLDQTTGWVQIPAEFRKWRSADLAFQLHPQTLAALTELRTGVDSGPEALMFPWPYTPEVLWTWYKKVLRSANLPAGRKQMFHAIRRTVASHLDRAGVDSSRVLGHLDRTTTRDYISPAISSPAAPATVLPRLH